jgi:hypothetical protein
MKSGLGAEDRYEHLYGRGVIMHSPYDVESRTYPERADSYRFYLPVEHGYSLKIMVSMVPIRPTRDGPIICTNCTTVKWSGS